jgi:hypothetical protein
LFNYFQTHFALSHRRGMQWVKRQVIARVYCTINTLSGVIYAKATTNLHTTRKWRC